MIRVFGTRYPCGEKRPTVDRQFSWSICLLGRTAVVNNSSVCNRYVAEREAYRLIVSLDTLLDCKTLLARNSSMRTQYDVERERERERPTMRCSVKEYYTISMRTIRDRRTNSIFSLTNIRSQVLSCHHNSYSEF